MRRVRIPSMLSFIFLHFYCFIFSHVSIKHFFWKTVLTVIQSVHQMRHFQTGTKTHMRDATEYTNSVWYALFAVIKAIFSNPNGLEMIMNYIQTIVSINKYKIEIKTKKKQGTVTGFELANSMTASGQAIHPLCCEFSL